MKRIIVVFLAAVCMLTVGCKGKSGEKAAMNYEQPVLTMIRAIKVSDNDSYLNCFTQGAREKYIEGESYNSELVKNLMSSCGSGSYAPSYSKNSAEELNSEQIDALENQYKEEYHKRINIKKAYEISADITVLQNIKSMKDSLTITVVYDGNGWLIYGDVIEELVFE